MNPLGNDAGSQIKLDPVNKCNQRVKMEQEVVCNAFWKKNIEKSRGHHTVYRRSLSDSFHQDQPDQLSL